MCFAWRLIQIGVIGPDFDLYCAVLASNFVTLFTFGHFWSNIRIFFLSVGSFGADDFFSETVSP